MSVFELTVVSLLRKLFPSVIAWLVGMVNFPSRDVVLMNIHNMNADAFLGHQWS